MYKPDYLLDDEELKVLAGQMEDMGRFGDSKLVHVNEEELRVLKNMGAGTRNPNTGLLEFYSADDADSIDSGDDPSAAADSTTVSEVAGAYGDGDDPSGMGDFGEKGTQAAKDAGYTSDQMSMYGQEGIDSIDADLGGVGNDEDDPVKFDSDTGAVIGGSHMGGQGAGGLEGSIDRGLNAIQRGMDLDGNGKIGIMEGIIGVSPIGLVTSSMMGLEDRAPGEIPNRSSNSNTIGDPDGSDNDAFSEGFLSEVNSDVIGDLRIDTNFEQLRIAPSGYAETSMVGGAAVRNPGFRKYDYSTGVASSERTAPVTGINARDLISSGAILNQDAYNVAQRATNSISSLIAETGQDFTGEIDVTYDRQGNLRIKLGNSTSPSYENSEKGFASMMNDVSKAISYGVSTEDFNIDESFARRSQLFYKYENTATEELQGLFDEITASADVALAIGDVASYNSAASELQDLQDELNRRASA